MPPRHGTPKQRRGDQAHGRFRTPWQDQVNQFLINGGTDGRGHTEMLRMYRGSIDAAILIEYLEMLRVDGKVDMYLVQHSSGKGTPRKVWRATTKILLD